MANSEEKKIAEVAMKSSLLSEKRQQRSMVPIAKSTFKKNRSQRLDRLVVYLAVVIAAIWVLLIESSAYKTASGAITPRPQGLSRELEKQIVDKILGEGYDKRIRPSGVFNNKTGQHDGPAIVRVNTLIRSISKIDDVTMEYSVQLSLRQEWIDERLAFNKMASYKNYNINSITLTEQERLWKPDLFFRNEKEGHFHKIIMPNVLLRINGDGNVLYSIRISLVLACPMDLKYYPLDKQKCKIEMASYGYLDTDLKFLWKDTNPVQLNQPLTLPRFTLETFLTDYCISKTSTGAYSCLRVDLIFKREFSYYLIQIYIPCCMLVIVSWVSFWLDPNAIPARVSLGVTTLLTMATQISGINASLPPVSYTKAIDVWTGVCLTFVFGALLEFALVNYASRSDAHARVQQARLVEELRARELEFQQRQQMAAAAAATIAAAQQQHKQYPSQQAYQQANHYPGQQHPNGYLAGTQAQSANGYNTQKLRMARATDGNGAPEATKLDIGSALSPSRTNGVQQQQTANGGQKLANGGLTVGGQQQQAANAGQQQQQYTIAVADAGPVSGDKQLLAGGKQCEIHHSILHPTLRSVSATGSHHQQQQHQHQLDKLAGGPKKSVNFCRAWLNKFPSRSKRIDVISRIFFPKMFALFNLVYWTTYLFREDDIVLQ